MMTIKKDHTIFDYERASMHFLPNAKLFYLS